MKKKRKNETGLIPGTAKVYGDPEYDESDDIYAKAKKVTLDDVGNNTDIKLSAGYSPSSKDGLDIPGAELDDADEIIGGEDEENNYYSLGGDSHDDLEEDQA